MKRRKKLPWPKLKAIENRFMDLRFSGVEDAINLMGLKDKKQHVYGGTGFCVRKNKPLTRKEIRQSDEEFQDSYNNYEENAVYTGRGLFKNV
jgi:hypothetical protein